MKSQKFIKYFLYTAFMLPSVVMAEYRVYQYYVKSRFELPQDKNSYMVTSTLDPVSYVSYHGGHDSLKVDLIRTWACVGHTGENKQLCAPPLERFMENEKLQRGRL